MSCSKRIGIGRRTFLKGGAVAAAMAGTSEPATAQSGLAQIRYPASRLANVSDLETDTPLAITYPDVDSPGVLLKLGQPVEGGVGSDQDIVAFSTLCPHMGWPLVFQAEDRTLTCPGHFSRFDCEAGGLQIWGHATQNLAQFRLRVDDQGDIFAESVDELIYGRLSNTLWSGS